MNPLNKIFIGIGAAIILIVVIAFVYLCVSKAHLETELAQSQANATACHMANDDFAAKMAQQNKAVLDLQVAGKQRERRARQAAFGAQQIARHYFLASKKLRVAKVTGDECAAARDLFKDYPGAVQ